MLLTPGRQPVRLIDRASTIRAVIRSDANRLPLVAANTVSGADAGRSAAGATGQQAAMPTRLGVPSGGISAAGGSMDGPAAGGASDPTSSPAAGRADRSAARLALGRPWHCAGGRCGHRDDDRAGDRHARERQRHQRPFRHGDGNRAVRVAAAHRGGVRRCHRYAPSGRKAVCCTRACSRWGSSSSSSTPPQDPQIARVAGRTASVGTVMIAATLAVTYLVAGPLIWLCLRRARLPLLGLRRGPGHSRAGRRRSS